MKTWTSTGLAILLASFATSTMAVPPPVAPPQGGTMAPTAVGGTMARTSVGGTANAQIAPNNMLEPLPPLSGGFGFGPPGGTVYLNSYGYYPSPAVFGAPGAMLNGNGVGGTKSTTVIPQATATPGSTLNPSSVGGTYHGTIVAGGAVNNTPGATLSGNGVGGTANGVIVTGGATSTTTTPATTAPTTTTGTSSTTGSSVIVTGGSTSK